VRDSINKAYEAGGRPLIDVLDAQRNYRETYRLFIESRANLGRAEARYHALLGRKVTP
jgi:cobalt-zinc-cadmium efflux system outer membrane protein